MRKYLERELSQPGILIFKEKHGNRYFVCNNKTQFCKAAMHVLRGRLNDGYWYQDDELSAEEISKKEAADYCGILYRFPKLCFDKTTATRISESNALEAAYEFMVDRNDYEYEGMRIERSEKLEKS